MKICPRCDAPTMHDWDVFNSLSRRDNKTYVCPGCGQDEAMFDFAMTQRKFGEEAQRIERAWLDQKTDDMHGTS